MKETTIAFMSDNHIKASAPGDSSEQALRAALSRYFGGETKPDALVAAGDLTDDGKPGQYARFREILSEYLPADTVFTGCMGNHEWYLWGWGCNILANRATEQLQELFREGTGLSAESDTRVNGIHILCVSADNELICYRRREAFLREHIARAEEEDPEKPIFLVCHMGARDTVLGTIDPDTGSSDFLAPDWSPEFIAFLEARPRLIYVSGHTHADITDPRSFCRKGFTAVNCGCAGEGIGTGLLATVKPDNTVILERLRFEDGAAAAPPWVIRIPEEVRRSAAEQERKRRGREA